MNQWLKDHSFVNRFIFPAPNPSGYSVDRETGMMVVKDIRGFDISCPQELCWIPVPKVARHPCNIEEIPCLWLQTFGAKFVVIYLHGNGEDIGYARAFVDHLRKRLNVHAIALEYPGYGVCEGSACEGGIDASLTILISFLSVTINIPLANIILLGRSIGSGPATRVASKMAIGGLVLMSAYTSIRRLSKLIAGIGGYFVSERWDNLDAITTVTAPVLFIHGVKDRLIPFTHSEELFKACKARKDIVLPKDMDHNTFHIDRDVVVPILKFFGGEVGGLPSGGPRLVLPREIWVAPRSAEVVATSSFRCM